MGNVKTKSRFQKTGPNTVSAVAAELDTPLDLARALQCTPQTVNTWHRKGIIPAKIAVGRIIRFDRSEVIAALEHASKKGAMA